MFQNSQEELMCFKPLRHSAVLYSAMRIWSIQENKCKYEFLVEIESVKYRE